MLTRKVMPMLFVLSVLLSGCRADLLWPAAWAFAHADLSKPLPEREVEVEVFLADLDEIMLPQEGEECATLTFSDGWVSEIKVAEDEARELMTGVIPLMSELTYTGGMPVAVMYGKPEWAPCDELLSVYALKELLSEGSKLEGIGLIATFEKINLTSIPGKCSVFTVFNTLGETELQLSSYQAAQLLTVLPEVPSGQLDLLLVYQEAEVGGCQHLVGAYQMISAYQSPKH